MSLIIDGQRSRMPSYRVTTEFSEFWQVVARDRDKRRTTHPLLGQLFQLLLLLLPRSPARDCRPSVATRVVAVARYLLAALSAVVVE